MGRPRPLMGYALAWPLLIWVDDTTLATLADGAAYMLLGIGGYGIIRTSHGRGGDMPTFVDPETIEWYRYPALAENPHGKRWIKSEALLGLAPNTIDAYARGVNDFLDFCRRTHLDALAVSKSDIACYVGDLRQRPVPQKMHQDLLGSNARLSNATLQQRITAVRLFFDFLVEEHLREENPVSHGRYTPGKAFGTRQERALIPKWQTLPWIPTDAQWQTFLTTAQSESIRTRCMIALAYDAALRREELCSLQSDDVDPAYRLLRLRAETTKGHRQRTVPYSATSGELLRAYLLHRKSVAKSRGPLFLSESPRNYASPLTLWTWSKVVRQIANRAGLPQFSTHTFRHLCLTDLARAGWDLHEIAVFAGHRNPQTTLLYIHLSGHDLADRLAQGMEQIHAWRLQTLAHTFSEKEGEE